MADLFSIRDRATVQREPRRLERHSCRSDTFINALDFSALDMPERQAIIRQDECLDEQLDFGRLYLMHLDNMLALKQSLTCSAAA